MQLWWSIYRILWREGYQYSQNILRIVWLIWQAEDWSVLGEICTLLERTLCESHILDFPLAIYPRRYAIVGRTGHRRSTVKLNGCICPVEKMTCHIMKEQNTPLISNTVSSQSTNFSRKLDISTRWSVSPSFSCPPNPDCRERIVRKTVVEVGNQTCGMNSDTTNEPLTRLNVT